MRNPNAKNMDADKAYVFHTTIAKALFLYKREILNILMMVPFFCTRFKGPYEDDRSFFLE